MDRLPAIGRFVLIAAAEGVIGQVAIWSITSSVAPSPIRDAVLLAIWPLVILVGGAIAIAWIRRPTSGVSRPPEEIEPEPIDSTRAARLAELELADNMQRERSAIARLRHLVDVLEERRAGLELLEAPIGYTEAQGWAWIDEVAGEVRSLLTDEQRAAFDAPTDPAMLAGPEWRVRVASHVAVLLQRLRRIVSRRAAAIE